MRGRENRKMRPPPTNQICNGSALLFAVKTVGCCKRVTQPLVFVIDGSMGCPQIHVRCRCAGARGATSFICCDHVIILQYVAECTRTFSASGTEINHAAYLVLKIWILRRSYTEQWLDYCVHTQYDTGYLFPASNHRHNQRGEDRPRERERERERYQVIFSGSRAQQTHQGREKGAVHALKGQGGRRERCVWFHSGRTEEKGPRFFLFFFQGLPETTRHHSTTPADLRGGQQPEPELQRLGDSPPLSRRTEGGGCTRSSCLWLANLAKPDGGAGRTPQLL